VDTYTEGMKVVINIALLLASAIASSATSTNFGLSHATANSGNLFGVGRGGALFGGKDATKAAVPEKTTNPTYPAMSADEVEDWLAHIPVFAVTDSKGSGVILRPDNDTSVFYFFMSPQMANATLETLKSANENMDLRISAFSLGKIWFKVLNSANATEVMLQPPSGAGEGEITTGVEYRLVPDTRDLMGARMLLTMDPEDGEKLKAGGSLTAEDAQAAIKKAMTESPKFKETFNEIPVFMIAQMRMQKPAEEDAKDGDEQLLPMYFSLQNMVGTWQQFISQSTDGQSVEPAINLMDLHELVGKMQEESEIDFRNVLLIPSVPMGDANNPTETMPSDDDPVSQMGGDTLGDL